MRKGIGAIDRAAPRESERRREGGANLYSLRLSTCTAAVYEYANLVDTGSPIYNLLLLCRWVPLVAKRRHDTAVHVYNVGGMIVQQYYRVRGYPMIFATPLPIHITRRRRRRSLQEENVTTP